MGDAMLIGEDKDENPRINVGRLLTNSLLDNSDILRLIQDYKVENGIADDDVESNPYAFNAEKFQEYIKSHLEEEITKHKLLKEAGEIVASIKAEHIEDLKDMTRERESSRSNLLRLKNRRDDCEKEATNSHGTPVKWSSKEEINEMVEEFKKLHKQQEDLMLQCITGDALADSTFGWNVDMYFATEKLKRVLVDKIISEKYHQPRSRYQRQNFMEEYTNEYNSKMMEA